MSTDAVIAAVAREFKDFTLGEGMADEPAEPFANYCEDAKALWRYTDDVLNRYVRGSTDLIRLAQAKVLLVDRYLDFRAYAAKVHRDKVGEKGHICLYQVWIAGLHEVRTAQLKLDPPEVLIVPPKSEPTPPAGAYALLPPAVFLGELQS
jgi:hypothetical protein